MMPLLAPPQPLSGRDRLRLSPRMVARVDTMRRWGGKLLPEIRRTFAAQIMEASQRVRNLLPMNTPDELHRWSRTLYRVTRPAARACYDAAWAEALETIRGRFIPARSTRYARKEVTHVHVAQWADMLTQPEHHAIDGWLEKVASSSTAANARRLDEIQQAARTENLSIDDLAQRLLDEGLAKSAAHAQTIARTDSSYSYNAGLKESYKRQGIVYAEWLTSHSDRVCPFCAAMDGRRVPIDASFLGAGGVLDVEVSASEDEPGSGLELDSMDIPMDILHPPLHPNCECTLVPYLGSGQASPETGLGQQEEI